MTKILLVALLVATITPVFAEDAQVLPQGAGRFYVVPGYAWAIEKFDKDGARDDVDDLKFAGLAVALEYGLLPWLSTGLKWTPGWVYYGTIENQDEARFASISDLEFGLRTQIVGPEAPVRSDTLRFAVSPGLLIPTPGPDWAKEWENRIKGDEYTAISPSNHALGFGLQAAVDYAIGDNFFISLFGEGRFYLPKPFEKVNLTTVAAVDVIDAGFKAVLQELEKEGVSIESPSYNDPGEALTNLGYDLNIEVSPHFDIGLTKGVQFGASLPFDYYYTPGLSMVDEYAGDADFSKMTMNGMSLPDTLIKTYEDSVNEVLEDGVETVLEDTDGFLMSITPGISVFFTAIPVPIEVTLDYAIPLAGKNTHAQNVVSSQIQFYFAF